MDTQILREMIDHKGALSLAEYMEVCLQHPIEGYYSTSTPIGRQGDFVTAPEISQMFGEILAIWLLDVWEKMGRPQEVNLIELGPGRGTLIADILRVLKSKTPGIWSVHLVEINPHLRQMQADALKGHPNISWHPTIATALTNCHPGPLFIVANEFFDALPIHQYKRDNNRWMEHMIIYDHGAQKLCSSWQTIKEPELPSYKQLLPTTTNEIIEVSPAGQKSITTLTDALLKHTGVMIIIDYGYSEGSTGDTLQAVRNHRFHPVLESPGHADISAHVDFRALKDRAILEGATAFGPISQSDFLLQLGILTRAAILSKNATAGQKHDIETALMRLIHPQHMGTLFKVMAVMSPTLPQPEGFLTC